MTSHLSVVTPVIDQGAPRFVRAYWLHGDSLASDLEADRLHLTELEWVETKSVTINSILKAVGQDRALQSLLVHPVFARSHKSNAPQRITRRRSTGSGGDVRELLTGDDPSAMLIHS